MIFKDQLNHYTKLVNSHLLNYFDCKEKHNKILIEAMKYSITAGGKRLRPILAISSYQLFSNNIQQIMPYACAIEMIHSYSLIHDDLPAMDDDDYRRGKLTNHKVYGEGPAILAGDGLLNYSFEIMLDFALKQKDLYLHIRGIKEIANSAGINGMIGGQIVDLESENKSISEDILNYIHLNKTAALIIAPLKIGAIIGGANEEDIENMEKIGLHLGLAFQIKDDILDIVGDEGKLGKTVGKDIENHKSTYPTLFGLESSIKKVETLTENVNSLLKPYGDKANFLLDLNNYLLQREF